MAKTQTERNELKRVFTENLQELVESKYGAETTVKTVKGFVLEVDGEYLEVSAVVKKADKFDLEDAHQEYLDKVEATEKREAERAQKKAEKEAEKKAKSKD